MIRPFFSKYLLTLDLCSFRDGVPGLRHMREQRKDTDEGSRDLLQVSMLACYRCALMLLRMGGNWCAHSGYSFKRSSCADPMDASRGCE